MEPMSFLFEDLNLFNCIKYVLAMQTIGRSPT